MICHTIWNLWEDLDRTSPKDGDEPYVHFASEVGVKVGGGGHCLHQLSGRTVPGQPGVIGSLSQ